jgi:serralysin
MPSITESIDASAATSTAYALAVGQTARGTVSSNDDHDWYRVILTAGQTYTFALVGTGGNGLQDAYLRLRNSAGTQITYDNDRGPGSNSTITFTAATSGTYYLDVGSYLNGSSGQYGLSFTAGSRAHYDYMMGAGNLIRDGASWSATPGTAVTVTYSFDTSNPDQTDASGNLTAFIALTAAQRTAAQQSLSLFSEVGNITFTQAAANTGTMRFSAYNSTTDGAGAYASFPGGTGSNDLAGDVNLNNDSVSTTSIPLGSYSFFAMMHEIGHAMGLAHPGDYNAAPGVSITYDTHAQFIEDSHQYSVMSYFDESNTTSSFNSYPDTLLMHDILAIQQLYGANYNIRSGNSVYGFNANTGAVYDFTTNIDPVFCIWDGGGTDTIDASAYSMAQRINLGAATFSNIGGFSGNISIAVGATIENAIGGSGNDFMIGNNVANKLTGSGGNDTIVGNGGDDYIDGGAGADSMRGGIGNDTYIVQNTGDIVDETTLGGGLDLVKSAITYTLGSGLNNLTLTGGNAINGYGNAGINVIQGNLAHNVLTGNGGNDTFVFKNTLTLTNFDTVMDFGYSSDVFHIDNAVFKGLSTGTLSSDYFTLISSATSTAGVDGDDRILYDKAHGNLYFDKDGSGGTYNRVRFAVVDDNATVLYNDFVVI